MSHLPGHPDAWMHHLFSDEHLTPEEVEGYSLTFLHQYGMHLVAHVHSRGAGPVDPETMSETYEPWVVVNLNGTPAAEVKGPLFSRVLWLASRVIFQSERKFGIEVGIDIERRVYFEILCSRPDTFTGEFGTGRGGRRYLRPDIGVDELNRAIFGAYVAYSEHECRESYTVDGIRVFGPHIPLEALLVAGRQVEVRKSSPPTGAVD